MLGDLGLRSEADGLTERLRLLGEPGNRGCEGLFAFRVACRGPEIGPGPDDLGDEQRRRRLADEIEKPGEGRSR